jgi:hypothetical protein
MSEEINVSLAQSSAEMDQYQVKHLLLLVGSNPLPNAVAAMLLARSGTIITLVHSDDAFGVAQRIQAWWKDKGLPEPRLKKIAESEPGSIFRGVSDELKEVGAASVGLHYTGGTKAMSVHAYRAIEQWANQQQKQGQNIKPVFSYLNPRKLEMVFDPMDPASGEVGRIVPVSEKAMLSLDDLLNLHGLELEHKPSTQSLLPKTAGALLSVSSQSDAATAWREWIREELFWKAMRLELTLVKCDRAPDENRCLANHPSKRKWRSKGQLKKTMLQWPSAELLQIVTEAMKDELGQTDSLNIGEAANVCGYREPEDFCKWLNGLWLESSSLQALQECIRDCSLHDVYINLKPKGKVMDFEFDVVAIRGYQLFAISCSTDSDKGFLKLKLFEAVTRARQLGGDEARVAMVCCSSEPEKVEQEVRRDVDPEGRIRVFGQPQLADLGSYLKQWIQKQSKGG